MPPGDPKPDFTVHPEPPAAVEAELARAMLLEQVKARLDRMTTAQLQAVLQVLRERHPWDDVETARRKLKEVIEDVAR